MPYQNFMDGVLGLSGYSGYSGGGGVGAKTITQVAHGLIVGNVVRFNGTDYVKALSDTPEHAEVVGIVSQVIDSDTFVLTTHGYVSTLSGLTPGEVLFLSDTTPGLLVNVDVSTIGSISKPLFICVSSIAGYFFNFRGIELAEGEVGASGFSGYSGISGFSGYSGISGFSGYSGRSGYSGYSGATGATGTGISGFSGFSGSKGDAGNSGFSGYSGISGFSGYSGISGFSGYSGISGYSGYSGSSGYSGYSGPGDMILASAQTNSGVKTFLQSTVALRNPANTFSYFLSHGAIGADRTLILPILTSSDTVAVLGLAQTLQNKTFSGTFFINCGLRLKITDVTTNYSALSTDAILSVSDTSSARTITLPFAVNGTVYTIKDTSGAAGTNAITINPQSGSGEGFDGAGSYVINTNYGTVTLFGIASIGWFKIG